MVQDRAILTMGDHKKVV